MQNMRLGHDCEFWETRKEGECILNMRETGVIGSSRQTKGNVPTKGQTRPDIWKFAGTSPKLNMGRFELKQDVVGKE